MPLYHEKGGHQRVLWHLMSLPLLPASHMHPAFDAHAATMLTSATAVSQLMTTCS